MEKSRLSDQLKERDSYNRLKLRSGSREGNEAKETIEELKNVLSFLTEGKEDVDLQVEKQTSFRNAKKKRDDA